MDSLSDNVEGPRISPGLSFLDSDFEYDDKGNEFFSASTEGVPWISGFRGDESNSLPQDMEHVAPSDTASDGTIARETRPDRSESQQSVLSHDFEGQGQSPSLANQSLEAGTGVGHGKVGFCPIHLDNETVFSPSSNSPTPSSAPLGFLPRSDSAIFREKWPLLAPGSESKISTEMFFLHQAYEKERVSFLPLSLPPARINLGGLQVPVFKKPPGFSSQFCKPLQKQATETKTFNMELAVCIVDASSINAPGGHKGVSFSGVGDRNLDGPFESNLYVARRGFARRTPEGVAIKPWQFEVVVEKIDKKRDWCVCIFVPLNIKQELHDTAASETMAETAAVIPDQGGATQTLSSHPSLTTNPANFDEVLSSDGEEGDVEMTALVEKRVSAWRSKKHPSEQTVQLFRKRMRRTLRQALKSFTMGKSMSPEWRDCVFKDWYQRLSFEDYCEWVDKYHNLPHNRTEREVNETGILVEEDLPNLVETVENMFLYLKEEHSKILRLQFDVMELQRNVAEINLKVTLAEERSDSPVTVTQPATNVKEVDPIMMTQGSAQTAQAGSMSDRQVEERVLQILQASQQPLHKLNIRRLFPSSSDGPGPAGDRTLPDVARVNKALYSLRQQNAIVEHGKSGSKPLWASAASLASGSARPSPSI